MESTSALNHLSAWVQQEIVARKRVLALLDEQESSIRQNDPEATAAATRRLEAEMKSNVERSRARKRAVGRLADLWQVPADALTLGSIAERAGDAGASLLELRTELRRLTAEVVRRNRRLSALIGMHRRITKEVIETVLEEGVGAVMNGAGSLIDAEA